MEGEARRYPSEDELHQVPREDEDHHARDSQREVAEKDALPAVSSEVVPAEVDDRRAEERDEREHHRAEPVDPRRKAEPTVTEQRACEGRLERGERGGERCDQDGQQGGCACGHQRHARSRGSIAPCEERCDGQTEWREKGHQRERALHRVKVYGRLVICSNRLNGTIRSVLKNGSEPMLNFHHLHYFWAVAHEENLTRAAARLHVSQSAVSMQIQKLEADLGHPLFERLGKRLMLTEAGRIALDHADAIFARGDELESALQGRGKERRLLRVGSLATLSRNFQLGFLRPLFVRDDVEIVVRSGAFAELLQALEAHRIDVLLANTAPLRDAATPWVAHAIGEPPVSLVGAPTKGRRKRSLTRPFECLGSSHPRAGREHQLVVPNATSMSCLHPARPHPYRN